MPTVLYVRKMVKTRANISRRQNICLRAIRLFELALWSVDLKHGVEFSFVSATVTASNFKFGNQL